MNEAGGLLLEGVSYSYGLDPTLQEVTVAVEPGECVALMGPSGCGKSTLLLIAAGILVPDRGRVLVGDQVMPGPVDARAALRRSRIGLVFQFGELVGELSLRENVALAAELAGVSRREALRAADELLRQVGLEGLENRKPSQVSGGQAQRAAVARALVHRPGLVLADEPTGALDSANAAMALDLLLGLAAEAGACVLVATHDEQVAARCDRMIRMVDGRVATGSLRPHASSGQGAQT